MRPARATAVVLAHLFVAVAAKSEAQVCSGFASFRDRALQFSFGATVNPDALGIVTSMRGGKKAFAWGATGVTRYHTLDGSSNDLTIGGGYEFAVGRAQRAFVCPSGSLTVSAGPYDVFATSIDYRTLGLLAGVSVGAIVAQSRRWQIMPSVTVRAAQSKSTARHQLLDISTSQNNRYGVFSAAVGFVIRRSLTVQPGVSMPFGLRHANANLPFPLHNADPTFTLRLAFSFIRRARPIRR